ncbi:MAG: 4-hydroxybenzoyl-CoA thioesterase [Denitrovibrio sp.]|nr:MAG: 4-hydroxybenzoyl-CoA thioesterase [Denitrovibrio sp.]
MKEYDFKLSFKVRDYEVDMEGVVNNSVYMNYLEHARHEFLLTKGIDFADCTQKGIILIVAKAVLEFKSSLRSGDKFWVGVNCVPQSKVRIVFYQDIYREADNKLVLKGEVTGTGLGANGRPHIPDHVLNKFGGIVK